MLTDKNSGPYYNYLVKRRSNMPVVHSLQVQVSELKQNIKENDFNDFLISITEKILIHKPEMVIDVAEGRLENTALENEIIRIIDSGKNRTLFKREDLIKRVFDFLFGYGELQKYIDDEEITDIDGTSYNRFVIKRNGIREKLDISFGNERIFDTYCKLIAIRNNGILNENDNHCRVTDEKNRLRINLSVRPRSITGPTISIRKHRKTAYDINDLLKLGMVNKQIKKLIESMAKCDATVIFCGKGAAGKTTLLRAFVDSMPEMERVLIAESDCEIYPNKPYCIQHRIKKKNEGGIDVTLQDLIRDGLTMSLDTYCIGEITGNEAWDFIKASFSGHRCTGTIHAENAQAVFARLMALARGESSSYSERTIMQMAAEGIDAVVYMKNFRVEEILEVTGFDADSETAVTKILYHRQTGETVFSPSDRLLSKGVCI